MSKKRRLLIAAALFVLYNIVSGGGILIERVDSVAAVGVVARAKLTEDASIYLKERPSHQRFYLPFVFYYFRETYPMQVRYYASTRDGSIRVSNGESSFADTSVVVTEVKYYRKQDGSQDSIQSPVFKAGDWNGIVITEPGDWIVESTGYLKKKEGKAIPLTFPKITIQQTKTGKTRVTGLVYYWLDELTRM